jgi:hypothetical protein
MAKRFTFYLFLVSSNCDSPLGQTRESCTRLPVTQVALDRVQFHSAVAESALHLLQESV